jgi:hypothetical protein
MAVDEMMVAPGKGDSLAPAFDRGRIIHQFNQQTGF